MADTVQSKPDSKSAPRVGQPMDLTIIVGGSEFPAHKSVLIAASHFFRNMFAGGLVENRTNRVKLQGLNPEVIRTLIEFAYTEDGDTFSDNPLQILECASYLQMPTAIEACTKKLVSCLSPNNCMEILSKFLNFSLESAVEMAKDYIKSNVTSIKENCPVKSMPLAGIQVVMDFWDDTEMKGFKFVESWIGADPSRNEHINDLMCRVRFPLMTRMEITNLKRKKSYKESQEPWCALVDKALLYHNLPMHQRVLDKSLQTQLRTNPTPVLFTQARSKDSVTYYFLDKENKWRAHDMKPEKMPSFSDSPTGIEVNNFYIVYTGNAHRQGWRIFDPRTQTWGKMKDQELLPQQNIEVVYYDKHLYVIGGWLPLEFYHKNFTCIRLERYSFESDSWTPMPPMPVYVTGHKACILNGTLYVTGGYADTGGYVDDLCQDEEYEGANLPLDENFHDWIIEEHDHFLPSRLYSIDVLSPSPKWTKLRSCPQRLIDHAMCIMKIGDEEVIAVVEEGFDVCVYNPSTTHWSKNGLNFVSSFYDYKVADGRSMLTKGQKLFFMNMFARPDSYEPGQSEDCPHGPQCALWSLTADGQDVVQHDVEALPFERNQWPNEPLEPFGALLALPPNVTGRRCSVNTEQAV